MAENPNYDDKINNFNQESEKKKQEEMASSVKPKISKKTASLIFQYGMITITVGGIFYKMFIQDTSGKSTNKQPIQYVKKEEKKEDFGNVEIKATKKATIADKNIGVDIGYKSRTNNDVEVPSLVLPKVPQIDIDYKEEKPEKKEISRIENLKKAVNEEAKATPRLIMPTASPLELASNLESKVNSKNEENNIQNNQNKKEENVKIQDLTMNNQANSAMGEMFLVKGNGGKQSERSSNKSDSDKDIIIFNGSRFSEVENNVQETQVQKIKNLSNTILTGKMIEAVLETAINTQMPGTVRAVVSRDIYAESGDNIIIPAGSRLYGTYMTNTTPGDSRVGISWNRIIRPDAISISISAQAVDESGQAGIQGKYDGGELATFKNAMLLSFISLGTAIATQKLFNLSGQSQIVNSNGSTATVNVTPANAAVQNTVSLANNIASGISKQLTSQVKPIITIYQGTRINVSVNQDITVQAYIKSEI